MPIGKSLRLQGPEEVLEVKGRLHECVSREARSLHSGIDPSLARELDTRALDAKADEVEAAIKKLPGIVDTKNGVIVSGPAVTFKIDPLRAAQLGVTANDVAATVTTNARNLRRPSTRSPDQVATV